MAKRNKKVKVTEWKCPQGTCDVSKSICQHLEKELPQMRDGDMPQLIAGEAAARSSVSFHNTVFWSHSEDNFLQLMRNYGFTEKHDLDLLSAKYFRNLSVRDIEDEFGWTSKSAVQRKLKELRDALKKRGFKQELE